VPTRQPPACSAARGRPGAGPAASAASRWATGAPRTAPTKSPGRWERLIALGLAGLFAACGEADSPAPPPTPAPTARDARGEASTAGARAAHASPSDAQQPAAGSVLPDAGSHAAPGRTLAAIRARAERYGFFEPEDVQALREAHGLHAQDAELRAWLARALRSIEDWDALAALLLAEAGSPPAAFDARRLADTAPRRALELASVLARAQRFDEAAALIAPLVEADDQDPERAWLDAYVAHALGEDERAAARLDAALPALLAAGRDEVRLLRGTLALRLGHAEAACEWLRPHVAAHPDDPAGHNALGQALAALGERAAAQAELALAEAAHAALGEREAQQLRLASQARALDAALEQGDHAASRALIANMLPQADVALAAQLSAILDDLPAEDRAAGDSPASPTASPTATPTTAPTAVRSSAPKARDGDGGDAVLPSTGKEPAGGSAVRTARGATTSLRFVEAATEAGLGFRHHAGRSAEKYMPEVLGGGVLLTDVDGDGAVDVLCLDSGALAGPPPAGSGHRLFLNDGRGHFRDATDAWGLTTLGYGMGGAAADLDADGHVDLFLTSFEGQDRLLRNTGSAFEDVTTHAGITPDGRWSTSVGVFDLEPDGDLDLYVVRYIDYPLAAALPCFTHRFHVYCTPVMYAGVPDRLLVNESRPARGPLSAHEAGSADTSGHSPLPALSFRDASQETGLAAAAGKGLALGIADLDGDGHSELFVANDSTRNALLVDDGRGQLQDRALLAGVAYGALGREQAGMGVDVTDADGDGRADIVCTNFQGEGTSIYCQQADGFFVERADALGVGRSSRLALAFGVDAFDADNDGDEDLLVATGHIDDVISSHQSGVGFAQTDILHENRGGGRFVDVSAAAGPALAALGVSRGLATGDLDGDGDLDYVVVDNDGPLRYGRNETTDAGAWASLWLEGVSSNREAIGARVVARLEIGTSRERTLERQVLGASSYLSASDRRIHLGLGGAAQVDELTIHWPGGARQVITALPAGAHYHLVEGGAPRAYTPGEFRRP